MTSSASASMAGVKVCMRAGSSRGPPVPVSGAARSGRASGHRSSAPRGPGSVAGGGATCQVEQTFDTGDPWPRSQPHLAGRRGPGSPARWCWPATRRCPCCPALTGLRARRWPASGAGRHRGRRSGAGGAAGPPPWRWPWRRGLRPPARGWRWWARADLGLAAAVEVGVALERLVLVAEPPPERWATVVAALVGAVDVVRGRPAHRVRTADARRLAARARERGTVLVQLAASDRARRIGPDRGLEVDLRLAVAEAEWHGRGPGARPPAGPPGRGRGHRSASGRPPPPGRAVAARRQGRRRRGRSGDLGRRASRSSAYAGADIDRLVDAAGEVVDCPEPAARVGGRCARWWCGAPTGRSWPPGCRSTSRRPCFHANRVMATSPAARADGRRACDQRRREAQARCPALVVLDHDPARDARAFEPVVATLDALTPAGRDHPPGQVAFPTRGPSRYFGGDDALAARRSHDRGRRACWPTSGRPGAAAVGIADGPFAAGLAAERRARPATGRSVVPPGGTPAFLAPLPVAVLDRAARPRPSSSTCSTGSGCARWGRWPPCPAPDVLARFGCEGQAARRLAGGLDERPPDPGPAAADLTVSVELDPPADPVDPGRLPRPRPGRGAARPADGRGPGLHPGGDRRRDRARRAARAGVAARGHPHRRRPSPTGSAGSSTAGSRARPRHRPTAGISRLLAHARRGRPRRRSPARVLGERRRHRRPGQPGRRPGAGPARRGPVAVPEWRGSRDPADPDRAGARRGRRPHRRAPRRPDRDRVDAARGPVGCPPPSPAVGARRAGRRPTCSTPTGEPVLVSGRGALSRPTGAAVGGGRARGPTSRPGPVPGRSTSAGGTPPAAPAPGPPPARHRRRPGPPAHPRGRPLAGRGDLRLTSPGRRGRRSSELPTEDVVRSDKNGGTGAGRAD